MCFKIAGSDDIAAAAGDFRRLPPRGKSEEKKRKERERASECACLALTQAERNLFRSKPRTKMTHPDGDRGVCEIF